MNREDYALTSSANIWNVKNPYKINKYSTPRSGTH